MVYANLGMLDLWEALGADAVGIARSQLKLQGFNDSLRESGLNPTSEEDLHNLEGKIVYFEFGWAKENILHLYREENQPLLTLMELFDTQLGLQTIEDFESSADELT